MNRRLTRLAIATAALTASSLGLAGAARADTAVMGSTLANSYEETFSANAPMVSTQISFDPGTSPNPVVSPANGVITGWKVRSADDGATYTLKVLRANGPVSLVSMTTSNFTGVASLAAPSAVPAGTFVASSTGKIFNYPGPLPISKGDYIGLLLGGTMDFLPQNTTSGIDANLIANNFSAQPADGSSADLLADKQHDLLLQATVQFCNVPSLKKLKTKAAKQALRAHDCLPKVKKKQTKKKKNRGKVLKQKTPAGTTAAPGTIVPIVIGKKPKP